MPVKTVVDVQQRKDARRSPSGRKCKSSLGGGGAFANKVRKEARRSQSVSTNAGRVTRWGGVDQGSRKRRMDRSEALEGKRPEAEMRLEDKQARNGKRVSFNETVKVSAEVQIGGSQRPVRSTARKEKGCYAKYFSEEPECEESFRCTNCKSRFSSMQKLLG